MPLQWSIPAGIEISAECRDLLTRMLVRNPDERITMAEIHKHPWFIANLPVEVSRAILGLPEPLQQHMMCSLLLGFVENQSVGRMASG